MDQRDRDHDHSNDARPGHRLVPDNAPDPVETRDPASHPTPRTGKALLFALPAVALLVLGIGWMVTVEGDRDGGEAPFSATGTSGERANDPEGGSRGETLNPPPEGPRVVGDVELLTSKEDYVGRAVEIAAIPVASRPGPRTFWVGRLGNRTLVLLDEQATGADAVQPGQAVRLSGTIERRPDEQALQQAGLDEKDREALEDEDVFIRARRVEPQGQVGPLDAPTRQ